MRFSIAVLLVIILSACSVTIENRYTSPITISLEYWQCEDIPAVSSTENIPYIPPVCPQIPTGIIDPTDDMVGIGISIYKDL